MSTAIGLLVLAGLFLLFPFVKRERKSGGCGTGGCWKKRIGFGCGSCPLDSEETGGSGADDHAAIHQSGAAGEPGLLSGMNDEE